MMTDWHQKSIGVSLALFFPSVENFCQDREQEIPAGEKKNHQRRDIKRHSQQVRFELFDFFRRPRDIRISALLQQAHEIADIARLPENQGPVFREQLFEKRFQHGIGLTLLASRAASGGVKVCPGNPPAMAVHQRLATRKAQYSRSLPGWRARRPGSGTHGRQNGRMQRQQRRIVCRSALAALRCVSTVADRLPQRHRETRLYGAIALRSRMGCCGSRSGRRAADGRRFAAGRASALRSPCCHHP